MLETLRQWAEHHAADHGIHALWLHGSRARGTARSDSDCDLCYLAATPLRGIHLHHASLDIARHIRLPVHLMHLSRRLNQAHPITLVWDRSTPPQPPP